MTQIVKVGSELIVNARTDPGDQAGSSIAALAGGRFVIAWGGSNGTRMQMFGADGARVGTEVAVQPHTSPDSHFAATLADGDFVVLSDDQTSLQDTIRTFGPDGTPVGTPFVDTASETTPAVAGLHNGDFVVAYQENVASPPAGSDPNPIEVQLFDAAGNPSGSAFQVNTAAGKSGIGPAVAVLANGQFVVTYFDSALDLRGQIVNADGTKSGNEFGITGTIFGLPAEKVAALPNGDFVVVWGDTSGADPGEGIRGEVFNHDGTPLGDAFQINTVTFRNQIEPDVAVLPGGQFVVTWMDAGGDGGGGINIAARAFNPDGTALSGEFLVNTNTQTNLKAAPTVSGLSNGEFVISWDDPTAHSAVHAQIFNISDGVQQEDPNGPHTPGRVDPPGTPPPTFKPDGPFGPSAGGHGDVHLQTYDGLTYDFQAAGEFELVKSTSDVFDVQIRLQPTRPDAVVSVITAVGVELGSHHFTFDLDRLNALMVDGQAATFNSETYADDLGGGYGVLQALPNYWILLSGNGERVVVTENFNGDTPSSFDVQASLGLNHTPGSVEGLVGNFDGDKTNDLQLGDGTVQAQPIDADMLYGAYADAWRITQATSLLDYGPGQTTDTFTDKAFPPRPLTVADLPADVATRAAATVDAAGITDPALRDAAILDYALTGDPSFIASAATAALQGITGASELDVTGGATPDTVGLTALQATQVQASGGTTSVTFEAFRTGDTSATVTLGYDVAQVGAGFLGAADFGGPAPSGTVAIAAGQASATFSIDVPSGALGTNAFENLRVEITDPAGLVIAAPTAQTEVFNSTAEPGIHAVPVFVTASNGTLTHDGNAWTLDLGTIAQGTPMSFTGFLANAAGAQANTLFPFLSTSGDAAFDTLFLSTGFSVTLSTAGPGGFIETIDGESSESNPTGFSADLPEQTLTITAHVTAPAGITAFTGARGEYDVRTVLGDDNQLHTIVTDQGAAGDGTQTLTDPVGIEFADHHIFDLHGAQQNHAASFDGGRFDDVLFQHDGDGVLVYAQMVDGAFQTFAVATTPIGSDWHVLATGDVNPSAGSGAELFAEQDSTGILAYSSTDTGAIVWHVVSATLDAADKLAAAADVNGDGSVDAVIQNADTGTVQYFDLKGGAVGDLLPAVQNINADWHAAGAGDLNGDGFADIVLQQASTGVTIYADMAEGSFAGFAGVSAPGTDWAVKAVADLNGDGFADVVFQDTATGSVIYADMLGGAFHGFDAVTTALPATWQVKGAADANNDGYADVIVQNTQSGETDYANMHGGVFTGWGAVTSGIDNSWHVA